MGIILWLIKVEKDLMLRIAGIKAYAAAFERQQCKARTKC